MLMTTKECYKELHHKIVMKEAVVGVVGLGYVGLPYAVSKAMEGYCVIGFDVQAEKVNKVNNAENYIEDVNNHELVQVVRSNKLKATTDFTCIRDVDIVLICVPTPLDPFKQPDLSCVSHAVKEISQYAKAGSLIILESTTYPGTTEDIIVPAFEEKGFTVGEDIFIAYSPERIDPSNKKFNVKNTPKIVGGVTKKCTKLAASFIGNHVVTVSSPKVAEMAKIHENTFRYINISLVNELSVICNKMKINVWEVIDAAKTKPYGFMAFYPSSGAGGHCIPVDPYYLAWKSRQYNYRPRMIESAGEINDFMPEYVVNRIAEILNLEGKAMKNSNIVILGVAYKKDINDTRESSVFEILETFEHLGVNHVVCDPHVETYQLNGKTYHTVPYSTDLIQQADLVLLATDHTNFDFQEIADHAKNIFDTRNAFKSIKTIQAKYYTL